MDLSEKAKKGALMMLFGVLRLITEIAYIYKFGLSELIEETLLLLKLFIVLAVLFIPIAALTAGAYVLIDEYKNTPSEDSS